MPFSRIFKPLFCAFSRIWNSPSISGFRVDFSLISRIFDAWRARARTSSVYASSYLLVREVYCYSTVVLFSRNLQLLVSFYIYAYVALIYQATEVKCRITFFVGPPFAGMNRESSIYRPTSYIYVDSRSTTNAPL